MATVKLKIDVQEDGTTEEPQARHHCPQCRAVTLAPLGQALVTCGVCGEEIVDERAFIELYGTYVARRLEVPHSVAECRVMGYAEVESLVAKSLAAKKGRC